MFYGRNIVVAGELAKQADGAVLVRYGETAVLSTAVAGNNPKDIDYFTRYQEKYAMERSRVILTS